MSQTLDSVVARVKDIKDVATDLARELVRSNIAPTSAILDLVVFIRTEAETILAEVNAPETRL